VALDGGCRLPDVPLVAERAIRQRLTMPLLVAPMGETKLAPRKRLPSLAAPGNREERAAAVALVRQAIELSRDLGTKTFVLDFGRVNLAVDEAELRAHFARRELDEGEVGRPALDAALAERRARGESLIDACRSSLDPLVREAERHAVRLALLPAATPWQVPSPRETTTLLEEFAGAPIATVFSPARLMLLAALGLGVSKDRRDALKAAAAVVEAADAVGLELPLLPGLGEVDLSDLNGGPADALIVLTGPPVSTDEEVAAARRLLESSTS
jgi:sugar phosphate isomerase/epimerase